MFGKIVYISNNIAHIAKNPNMNASNLMNMHIVLEDNNKKILSEVDDISEDLIKDALKEAILSGVTNFKYIDKIVYEWSKNGIQKKIRDEKETLEDMFDYDWLGEE